MKINTQLSPLISILEKRNKISFKSKYQKTDIWTIKKYQLLIDTILRNYDIPKIYFTKSKDSNYKYEVIDGQQRLKAIWGYYNNDYPLGDNSINLPTGDLSGKTHKHLPIDAKDTLDAYVLSVVVVEEADDVEIRDLFLRLQGKTLTRPRKETP